MVPLPRRLFIGLLPERKIQARIQRHCRDWDWPADARPKRFGRFHLTLHFLGEVGIGPEQRLRKALRETVVEPLELDLCMPEVWRNNVAVLQPADHEGLRSLQQRIAIAVTQAGLQSTPAEKFRPHVILARNAAEARPPAAMQPVRCEVHDFVLVWSLPWPEAKPARYEIVERFGLRPAAQLQPPAPNGQAGEQFALFG